MNDWKSFFQIRNLKSTIFIVGVVAAAVTVAFTSKSAVLSALQADPIAQPTQPSTGSKTLSQIEIDAIASQTTVVVGQDLQKGDIEARREFNPGSGVIIAKRGNTYYVATNLHVVRGRGGFYGVRTFDGVVYPVDDESTRSNIVLMGKEKDDSGETIQGLDVAIVQFQSNKNYPLANLPGSPNQGERAFVSGWPDPGDQTARRQRMFAPGEVIRVTPRSADGGYSIQYSCNTQRGMSGGPVFNDRGELVGIHGRAGEATSVSIPGTLVASLMTKTTTAQTAVRSKFNLGIRVSDLTEEAKKIQPLAGVFPYLKFEPPPVKPAVVSSGLPARRPRSADTIDDIYKTFSRDFKHAAVRDCPSAGSRTVLLGTSEERCPE